MKPAWYRLSLALILSLTFCITQARGEAEMIQAGKKVKFNYILKVDGKEIENTEGKGPLEYIHGQNKIIIGLEKQMEGLKVGDKRTFTVTAEEGFGQVDPNAFREFPKSDLPKDIDLKVGQVLGVRDKDGNSFPVTVSEIKNETVVLDLNHPLAGKDLQFEVTIVDIK